MKYRINEIESNDLTVEVHIQLEADRTTGELLKSAPRVKLGGEALTGVWGFRDPRNRYRYKSFYTPLVQNRRHTLELIETEIKLAFDDKYIALEGEV